MTGSTLAQQASEGAREGQTRIVVAAGLVWMGSQLLVQRRALTASHGAGALELPGGKLERGEGPRAALARELREEWGARAGELVIGGVVDVLHHVYPAPGPEVILIVLDVDAGCWGGMWKARVEAEPGVEVLAFEVDSLPVEEFLAADRPFLEGLRGRRTTRA
jgi:8-oxo-dGTP pyrophosphatase MutT (NUDIX family)